MNKWALEFCFDNMAAYMLPTFASGIVEATDQLGREQDPPFKHGNYFIEIRRKFLSLSWVNAVLLDRVSEPIFALCCRYDFLYIDANFTTFSTHRINDTFRTYSENLAFKWPGYVLGRYGHIFNATDQLVNMDQHLNLLRSKDIDRYEREKDILFG